MEDTTTQNGGVQIDEVDRQLLNTMQSGFPVTRRPFEVLGRELGISEQEVLARVRTLHSCGIIRRIGPSFESRKLGYASTLVAARVPQDQLKHVAGIINSYREVTHNYLRDCEYNLWFTLISESQDRLDRLIDEIKQRTAVRDMVSLPATRIIKLKLDFGF
ncbi:MAG: siroheme decarboxylase subunit alpha [Armatimonadota bacterium]